MRPLLALLLAFALNGVRPAGAQPVVQNLETTTYATAAGAAGLTFGTDQRLFVGRDAPGSTGITEQRIFTVPPGGGATTEYGLGIEDPLGVLFDPTIQIAAEPGSVIVAGALNATTGQLVAIPPSAAEPQPGASLEVLHDAAPLVTPSYLAKIGARLLIVDASVKAILSVVGAGAPEPFIPPSLDPVPTLVPRYVAVGGTDRIYVSYGGGTIRRFDAAGTELPFATPVEGLTGVVPIAVAPAGADFPEGLYAVEGGTGKLWRIADDGTKTEVGTTFPSSLGEIEFGPDGGLYVAAFSAGRVYRIGEPLPLPEAPDLGPYLCYNAKPAPAPPKLTVGLQDAIEPATREAKVGKAKAVCTPATVTVSPADPVENEETAVLASYQVTAGANAAQSFTVTNELGTHGVDVLKGSAARVLVPSAFSKTAAPTVLTPAARDFFQCYKARLAPGVVLDASVDVADPLGPGGTATPPVARTLAVKVKNKKRVHLCVPADVALDGQPIHRSADLLVCYPAKPAKGEPKATVLSEMHVGNARAPDQLLDMLKGSTTSSTSTQTGRIAGDVVETSPDESTRPGEWDLDDSEGPRWAGGGPVGAGDLLKATFSDAASLPEGAVRRFRVFVEIDIVVNDTNHGPGVVMRTSGLPGTDPEAPIELRAMASGKPAGVRRSSEWFDAPSGTTLAQLAESEQTFEANGDNNSGAFAFQIKSFGIEYEMSVTTGGARTGVPEAELCLPSSTTP